MPAVRKPPALTALAAIAVLALGQVAVLATARPASALLASALPASASCPASLPATGLDHAVPWPQKRLGLTQVWPVTQGQGITVAVVDTGVDGGQPFLKDAVLPGTDVINGGGPASTDCDGHGTFVAGIIAGRRLPGFGFEGVAPQATILPIRQANTTTDGNATTLANGIRAAVDAHAQVVNVSIVAAVPTLELTEAVQYALAHDVVIVAAAGNDFSQGNTIQYPAGLPGVLAVGAVDSTGQRASFSETGSNIGVVAPGVDVLGPGAGGPGLVTSQAGGTSFAAPFVAGVAALVRAYHPKLSAAQVIARIEATADHPPGPLPSTSLGWGEINPYAAVTAVLPSEAGPVTAPAPGQVQLPASASPGNAAASGRAAIIGVTGVGMAALILASTAVVSRGRRRGWRPGTAEPGHR
jgi:type VII secretion-associated serine protease mycosin